MAAEAQTPLSIASARRRVKYIRNVDKLTHIPEAEREKLRKVAEKYVLRANDYYLELIDWNDPNDPIKQLIIPRMEELKDWGQLGIWSGLTAALVVVLYFTWYKNLPKANEP